MNTVIQRIARTLRVGQIPQAIRRQLQSDGELLFCHEGSEGHLKVLPNGRSSDFALGHRTMACRLALT